MGSTGSVSSWDEALLVAMIQYPVPVITGPEDIAVQVKQICKAIDNTKAGYPGLDLIVMPEYSTQGLNTAIWTYDEMLLTIDSPEIGEFKKACIRNKVWGVFSLMEKNEDPKKAPYNTAIIINDKGEIALHYRKLQPWVPIEPWSPGNYGMPVCDGPKGAKLAVCISQDLSRTDVLDGRHRSPLSKVTWNGKSAGVRTSPAAAHPSMGQAPFKPRAARGMGPGTKRLH